MLTRHATSDSLTSELAAARALAADLTRNGLPVTRIKIESIPTHPDAPTTPAAAAAACPDRYLEHHIKLLLPTDPPPPALRDLAAAHHAHLSRNALRTRPDGRHERFLTQRFPHTPRAAAQRHLQSLLTSLTTAGYTILDVEEEYVLHDSNLPLDAGWLDAPVVPSE